MGDLDSQLERELLKALFKNVDPATLPVANVHLGVHTGAPGDDGSQNEVAETDYSRAETAPADWTLLDPTDPSTIELAAETQFDTAESTWGEITAVSAWDGPVGSAQHLTNFQPSNTQQIDPNDRLILEPGELSFNTE